MTQKIAAIIDYGSGNIRSAARACEQAAKNAGLDITVEIVNTPERLAAADHIILPGQGAFGDCMEGLKNSGMLDVLQKRVLNDKVPFLGICVGMQLMASEGLEHGSHKGLGWIEGRVIPLSPKDPSLKIPHMGWNGVDFDEKSAHNVLANIKSGEHYYFVHSFMFECKEEQHVLATCDYGGNFTAIVGRDNMVGVQFHPEKSQEAGLELLRNFLCWTPS